jgi:hypothetical protein
MADQKPEIPEGYLGPQEKFKQLGLSTMTHPDPEITARDNHLEIKIQAKMHVRFTHLVIIGFWHVNQIMDDSFFHLGEDVL